MFFGFDLGVFGITWLAECFWGFGNLVTLLYFLVGIVVVYVCFGWWVVSLICGLYWRLFWDFGFRRYGDFRGLMFRWVSWLCYYWDLVFGCVLVWMCWVSNLDTLWFVCLLAGCC